MCIALKVTMCWHTFIPKFLPEWYSRFSSNKSDWSVGNSLPDFTFNGSCQFCTIAFTLILLVNTKPCYHRISNMCTLISNFCDCTTNLLFSIICDKFDCADIYHRYMLNFVLHANASFEKPLDYAALFMAL